MMGSGRHQYSADAALAGPEAGPSAPAVEILTSLVELAQYLEQRL